MSEAANSGPRFVCEIGTISRRTLLGGGLCVLAWRAGGAEADVVSLSAQALPGGGFGYNLASPGPVLRAKVGRPLRIALANRLAEPTNLTLAGLRLPFAQTGFAGPPLAPGETREFTFLPQEPGFGLYLPYGPPASAAQLGAGLFGAIVVEEAAPPAVDLDAIVALAAKSAPLTLAAPPGGRVRLRLANASPDAPRLFRIAGALAHIVAIDGQPSELFAPLDGLVPLAPSARIELMLDMPTQAGARVTLAAEGEAAALVIEARGEAVAARAAIAALPANPRLPVEIALERAQRVTVRLTGDAAKGYAIAGKRPLFKAARGQPVALTLINATSEPQTLRLEGHVARILHALDDGWDPYWRDALSVAPGKTLHAAFVADSTGRWPLASPSPEKRAKGLAAWFAVG